MQFLNLVRLQLRNSILHIRNVIKVHKERSTHIFVIFNRLARENPFIGCILLLIVAKPLQTKILAANPKPLHLTIREDAVAVPKRKSIIKIIKKKIS